MWLCRIVRSTTCACLRLRNLFVFAVRVAHTRPIRVRRPIPPVCSRASTVLARDGCAAPIARYAHSDHLSCAYVGLHRSSCLVTYAGCAIIRARLRAQRAHQCALVIADPHKFYPLSQ
jgi:hypothetical protein